MHEREGLVGIHQRESFEFVEDVCEFYRVFFQEFTSGRKVEEQILYRQIRSGGTGFGGLVLEFGCGNLQMSADGIALAHCAQVNLCHRGDGWQSFAAEPHGMKFEKIACLPDFRSGMALEGQTRVGIRHSAAVVDYLNQILAAVAENNLNGGCTGVDCIFNQLLDYRSRALDNFSGGNLVGHRIRQKSDNVAHLLCLSLCCV